MFALKQGKAKVSNSVFKFQKAAYGGIAKILDEGHIDVSNSLVQYNQGIEGIFIHVEQSSIPFIVENTTFI